MKSIRSCHYIWKYRRFTHNSTRPHNQWVTVKRRKSNHTLFSVVFKQRDSMRNTFAITIVSKSSMKPWCSATTNRHLRSSGERNEEQMRTKVSFGRIIIQAFELLWLEKKHISRQSDIEQWRNQACSLNDFWVMLVWRHQSDSQIVGQ